MDVNLLYHPVKAAEPVADVEPVTDVGASEARRRADGGP